MGSTIKVIHLLATTILCIASAIVALAARPVLAVPQQAVITGPSILYDAPGLGIELEVPAPIYTTRQEWAKIPTATKEALKGKELSPQGYNGGSQTYWVLTAELSRTNLMTEIIVSGQKNKLGSPASTLIGKEIVDYMTGWFQFWKVIKNRNPPADSYALVNGNPGGTDPWVVNWNVPIGDPLYSFQPQVTAAMPMEGVLQLLSDAKADVKTNVLINHDLPYNKKIIVLTKKDFMGFATIRPADVTDEFLGFFSLLTTYCVVASEGDRVNGPKRGLNIMPRTNFLTMYNMFARDKLQEAFANSQSLYSIVRTVAALHSARDIQDLRFLWKPEDLRNDVSENWPEKDLNRETGNLAVKLFLDTLQGLNTRQLDLLMLMDKMVRHGQIGGLDDRVEGVYQARAKPAPIFEFRDLEPVPSTQLPSRIIAFNEKVIELHKQVASPTSLDPQEAQQQSNTNSEHQGQRLTATESIAAAERHKCGTESENGKPGAGDRREDQVWWLLPFIRRYSGLSKLYPADL
ncbi:hypothetical protein GGR57DRAFT_503747 [Xylariaceae sp. FL1272]|nr:hypothetical protein GGR57DRAFT_503747 [Xylariaceae sp. FL1272]